MKKLMTLQSRLFVMAAILGLIFPVAGNADSVYERNFYKDSSQLPKFVESLQKVDSDKKSDEKSGEEASPEENLKTLAEKKANEEKISKEIETEGRKYIETTKETDKRKKEVGAVGKAKEAALKLKNAINESAKKAIGSLNSRGNNALCNIRRPKEAVCMTNVNVDEMCAAGNKAIKTPGSEAEAALREMLKQAGEGKNPDEEKLKELARQQKEAQIQQAAARADKAEKEELVKKLEAMTDEERLAWFKKQNDRKNPEGALSKLELADAQLNKALLDFAKVALKEAATQEQIQEALKPVVEAQAEQLETLSKAAGQSASWASKNGLTVLDKKVGRKKPNDSGTSLGQLAQQFTSLYQDEPQRNAQEIMVHQTNVTAANGIHKKLQTEAEQLAPQMVDNSGAAQAAFSRIDLDSLTRNATNVQNAVRGILRMKGDIEQAATQTLGFIQPGLDSCDKAVELDQRIKSKIAGTKKMVEQKNQAMAAAAQAQQQLATGGAQQRGGTSGRTGSPSPSSLAGGSNPSNHFSGTQRLTN